MTTYQDECASSLSDENGRFFNVSKIRVSTDGHVSDVLWSEVSGISDQDFRASVISPAADVVDAIHDGAQVIAMFATRSGFLPERAFVIVKNNDGQECIGFKDPPMPGRNLEDMIKLDDFCENNAG